MYQITRKTYLARNLKRLQKLFPLEYDFFPKTWVLPNEANDLRSYSTRLNVSVPPKTRPTKKGQGKLKEKQSIK